MAPATSVPLGAINLNLALYSLSSIAPKVTTRGIPILNFPTSPSSTCPSKIILLRSAMVAIVEPALNVFACIT